MADPIPPLLMASSLGNPRSPQLRRVNQQALAYAKQAGVSVAEIYPNELAEIRAFAPPLVAWDASTKRRGLDKDALAFVAATGLAFTDVYPSAPAWASAIPGAEDTARLYAQLAQRPVGRPVPRRRWWWVAPVLGFVSGALAGGPVGAVIGIVAGGTVVAVVPQLGGAT